MDLSALKIEIETDPLGLGYAGKSHDEIAKILSHMKVREVADQSELPTHTMFSRFDLQEYAAAMRHPTNGQLHATVIGHILGMGTFRPGDDNVKDAIIFVFGQDSQTVQNLAPLRKRKASRAEELGFGTVTPSDVADALRS